MAEQPGAANEDVSRASEPTKIAKTDMMESFNAKKEGKPVLKADFLPTTMIKMYDIQVQEDQIRLEIRDVDDKVYKLLYKKENDGCRLIGGNGRNELFIENCKYYETAGVDIGNLFQQSERTFSCFKLDTDFIPTGIQVAEKRAFLDIIGLTLKSSRNNMVFMIIHLKGIRTEDDLMPVVPYLQTFFYVEISGVEGQYLELNESIQHMKTFQLLKFRTVVSDATLIKLADVYRGKLVVTVDTIKPEIVAAALNSYLSRPSIVCTEWRPEDRQIDKKVAEAVINLTTPISTKNYWPEEAAWNILYRFSERTPYYFQVNIRTRQDRKGTVCVRFDTK